MHALRRYVYESSQRFSACLSTLAPPNEKPKFEPVVSWRKSISDAEKVIGYPTSFLNLRWLLSDEIANVAVHLRKLMATDHPLLSIAKDLLMNDQTPSWGLIVLLVAKAGGQNTNFDTIDKDITAGILHSQRILAEITQMIRVSNLLHGGLVDITPTTDQADDMTFGNKIALLGGDYLLSTCFHELALIKNNSLNDLMSSSLRDLTESEFIGFRDNQNRPMPSRPNLELDDINIHSLLDTKPLKITNILGNARSEWTLRALLGGGTLLGKACQGALKLGGHDQDFEKNGYSFGKNLALTLQAGREHEDVCRSNKVSLVSSPLLFHFRYEPELYDEIEEMLDDGNDVDYAYVCDRIRISPALDDVKRLQKEFSGKALAVLENFNDSETRNALREIILASQI